MLAIVSQIELLGALSTVVDLVNPRLVDHQKKVAYIAYCIARKAELKKSEQLDILVTGLLHDIGATYLNLKKRLAILNFSYVKSADYHQELGYRVLNNFKPFLKIANTVRYHHAHWQKVQDTVPQYCHFIHLADRIAVLIQPQKYILYQVENINSHIIKERGKLFSPEIVDIFLELTHQESFWLYATSDYLDEILGEMMMLLNISEFNLQLLLSFTDMICKVVDFRSPFTATHSTGVAYTAKTLAEYIGLSERQCTAMLIAGFLHDIGKLVISYEILNKPDKLTIDEMKIMKSHTFYTFQIMSKIKAFSEIVEWSAFHHERLDGKGYPFHINGSELSLEARIMAVADIFTALRENRPYRTGMQKTGLITILNNMANNNAIDKHVTAALIDNFDAIEKICLMQQSKSEKKYKLMLNIGGQQLEAI